MRGGRRSFPLLSIALAAGFLACGDRDTSRPQGEGVQSGAPAPVSQETSGTASAAGPAAGTDSAAVPRDSTPQPTKVATATPTDTAPVKRTAPAPKRAARPPAPARAPADTPPETAVAAAPSGDTAATTRPAADTGTAATPPADTATAATPSPGAPAQAADTAPANAPLRDAYHSAPLDTVSQQVYDGWKQYNLNCARCHGEDVMGTTIAPHLVTSLKPNGPINTKELFVQTVCAGRPAKGMPAWCPLGLEMDKIEAIHAYVKGRSDGKIRPGRPAVKPES